MTVYVVVEHDPYLPKDGYDDHACAICATRERAEEVAKECGECYAPYWYTIERCEVIE